MFDATAIHDPPGGARPAQVSTAAGWPRARHFASAIAAWAECTFGALTLIVGLAVLATIPLLQLLSLGYLLEVSGRVARSGELRSGFVGLTKAAALGRVLIAVLLLQLPLWLAISLRDSAVLIDRESSIARNWRIAVPLLSLAIGLQFLSGCLRGGRLRDLLVPRPVKSIRLVLDPAAWEAMRDRLWDYVVGLRLTHYASLGLRGFLGALAWLIIPVTLLASASRLPVPAGGLAAILGGMFLALVLVHLPFLQANLAAENRFAAMFDIMQVRRQFARAPVAHWIALVFTLALAIPLYLLKVELIPREAAWLPSLLFVASIFPARLLAGWAVGRAANRYRRRHWMFRWGSRLAMLPVVAIYVVIVYFTQYLSWYGVWSLYEQHAFLVPAPFLGY